MHCVKCGTAIPEGAAFCPKCGASVDGGAAAAGTAAPAQPAQPRKKSNKTLGCIAAAVGILVLLFVIGSFLPDKPAGSEAPGAAGKDGAPAELPLAVSAAELFQAFQGNEASAQSYFGKRKLLVSGTVEKVMLDFMDDPVVLLRTPNRFMSAQAALADDAKGEAGNLGPGDKVEMLCEDVREVMGTPMLKDCRTAPPGTKSQKVKWADKK
ncbi:MAG TPA: zinc-ribbon domain-containing protein [Allosphingosinicella sp.]|jgi:hypothetical protein